MTFSEAWRARWQWSRVGLTLSLACLAWCGIGTSGRALAAPLGATIAVELGERASDCPDASQLTTQVERILQRSLAQGAPADQLEVQVRFGRTGDEYWANVLSRGPKPGERSLHDRSATCAPLAEAVSVTIALLLDKELERRAGSDSADGNGTTNGASDGSGHAAATEPPKSTPTKPARPDPQSATEPASSRARAESVPLELRASLEGGGVSGLVGQTSALLAEDLGVRWQRSFILDGGFNAILPGTTQFGDGSVRTTLLFASARACYVWGRSFSVGPCASFGVGRLQGIGIDYNQVKSKNLTWTAAGAGVVAEGPVWGRVFWGLSGTLWLPTHRSSFSVQTATQGVGTAWESSAFAGSVALRLGFRIL